MHLHDAHVHIFVTATSDKQVIAMSESGGPGMHGLLAGCCDTYSIARISTCHMAVYHTFSRMRVQALFLLLILL